MQLFEERERNLKNMLKALNHMKDLYQNFTSDVTSSRIVTVIASKPAWRKKQVAGVWGRLKCPDAVQTGAHLQVLGDQKPCSSVHGQTVQWAQSCSTFRTCHTNGVDDLSTHRFCTIHARHVECTPGHTCLIVLEILIDTWESKCINKLVVDSRAYFHVVYLHILLWLCN